jgi:type I restriction-modification system DNA methylase subunit
LDYIIKNKLELPDDAVVYRESCPGWDSAAANFPGETRNTLKIIKPDAVYHFKNQPFILFFDFTRADAREREGTIQKQIWCFDRAPVAIFVLEDEIKIFNAFRYQRRYDHKSGLQEMSFKNEEEKFKKFSFWELQSGNTWTWIQKTFYKKNTSKQRVNQKLFENIKDLRKRLTATSSKDVEPLTDIFANILILRMIFIRYLIDRGVEIDKAHISGRTLTDRKKHLNQLILDKEKLFRFFKYLKERFNGNLFETDTDPPIDEDHLEDLSRIFSEFKGQPFLFDVFDFSIIPVEIISGIYESVIDPVNRKKNSAIYTPAFLVDHILSQTVDPFLADQNNANGCKVLDPACGSGIFLVQAYRRLVECHHDGDRTVSDEELVQFMTGNLFGIDKDQNALNVAAFSLYVALLDYKDPPEIKNLQLPDLLGGNLFKADFFDESAPFNDVEVFSGREFDFILGNPPWGRNNKGKHHVEYFTKHGIPTANYEIAQTFLARTKDFANLRTTCALIVTSKALYNLSAKKKEYVGLTEYALDKLKQRGFPEEVFDKIEALRDKTYPDEPCFNRAIKAVLDKEQFKNYGALIKKYAVQGFKFYFLTKFYINHVLDLSPVRNQIFSQKKTPAMVLFYRYAFEKDTGGNVISHHSVKPNIFLAYFNSLVIEKHDRKKILQKYFIQFDWMFKVALYGNTIDFHFLSRLLENTTSIAECIDQEDTFYKGDGILEGTPKPQPYKFLEGLPIIEHEEINRYYSIVNTDDGNILKEKDTYLESGRSKELFDGHHILLKSQTVKNESEIGISYIETPSVFKHDVFGITTRTEFEKLKLFYGLMISSLFTYYQYMTSSAWGVATRPAIRLPEYLSFPFKEVEDKKGFIALVDGVIGHYKSHLSASEKKHDIPVPEQLGKINKIINSSYNVSKMEGDLIGYVLKVSRYQFQKGKMDLLIREPSKEELLRYARIFYNHFSEVYNEGGEYFQVNVYRMMYFTAMTFNIVTTPPVPGEEILFPTKTTGEDFLKTLGQTFSIYQQSSEIFLQKDVKGFEEDFFYIIKPNEFKCWHAALAYYDLAEFVKDIEKAELEQVTSIIDESDKSYGT